MKMVAGRVECWYGQREPDVFEAETVAELIATLKELDYEGIRFVAFVYQTEKYDPSKDPRICTLKKSLSENPWSSLKIENRAGKEIEKGEEP